MEFPPKSVIAIICTIFSAFAFIVLPYYNNNFQPLANILNRHDQEVVVRLFSTKELVLWNNDNHPAPIIDVAHFIKPLGVRVKFQVHSPYCSFFGVCKYEVKVINHANYMSVGPAMANAFYEAYRNTSIMEEVDGFISLDPPFMWQLFEPFNLSIVMVLTTRYYYSRANDAKTLAEWTQKVQRFAVNPRNVLAANNMYDVNLFRYSTGIDILHLPSFCNYTGVTYNVTRPEFILARRAGDHGTLEWFKNQYDAVALNGTVWKQQLILKGGYEHSHLATYRGIVHIPYQVSTMSFFEQYRMNIPLFFPSMSLLIKLQLERGILNQRVMTGARIEPHVSQKNIPDPFINNNITALKYWLQFADYYTFPHIVYFDSVDHLAKLLKRLTVDDLKTISAKMKIFNAKNKIELMAKWEKVLLKVAKYSRNRAELNNLQKTF